MAKSEAAFPTRQFPDGGMTLRDYFAAKAMQSLVQCAQGKHSSIAVATSSFMMADAMMAERDKVKPC